MDVNEAIRESRKRLDLNATESETWIKLAKSANSKGGQVRKKNKQLRKKAEDIYKKVIKNKKDFFRTENDLPEDFDSLKKCILGVDGSSYPVGGIGGQWYIPYSVVRIIYEKGLLEGPEVDVYAADINTVKEQDIPNIKGYASRIMLAGESKAIGNWGLKNKESIVFIDGPVVDPPGFEHKDYVKKRCRDIKLCLKKSIIIGCVKRSRNEFFKDHLKKKFKINKSYIDYFPGDQQLFAFLFNFYRTKNKKYNSILFTDFIDISNRGANKDYKKNGIFVASLFYQKDMASKIMRLDIPFLKPLGKIKDLEKKINEMVKTTLQWHYPGQDIPVPIQLAHEKCQVRQGCAEALYEEIMTQSASGTFEDQLIMIQLR